MTLDNLILNKVKEILENHKGKANSIKSNKVAELVGIDPGASNANIRKYITEILKKGDLPIAATPAKGYYLMETESELNSYIASLESRIREITSRIAWAIATFKKYHNSELLELSPEFIDLEDEMLSEE
ncbi:MAG: hypothetical protein ACTSRB_17925 [Candidatus Helarchaeota archaeon]